METIYRGVYKPVICYAAAGWADRLISTTRKKFMASQRSALIRTTGAFRTTALHALCAMTGNLPIEREIKKAELTYKLRKGLKINFEDLEMETRDLNRQEKENVKTQMKEKMADNWQEEWENSDKSLQTHRFIPDVREKMKKRIDLDRNIIQFITGHGRFGSHRKARGFKDDDKCECKNGFDTPEHALRYCKTFENIRKESQLNIDSMEDKDLINEKNIIAFEKIACEIIQVKEVLEDHEREEERKTKTRQGKGKENRQLTQDYRRITRSQTTT